METNELIYDGYVKIYNCTRERNGIIEHYNKVGLRGASAGIVINEDGKMALVKQYRTILGKVTLEIPAGTLDKNVSKQEIIIEELEEECGILRDDILEISEEPILTYNIIENMSDGEMNIYFIKVKSLDSCPKEDDEVDEVNFYDIDEIEDLIKKRIITDPKTLIAFYMYKDRL